MGILAARKGEPLDYAEMIMEMESQLAKNVRASGGGWVYITVDKASGRMMSARGLWESEADATLAAASDDDADSDRHVIPIFLDGGTRA